ncbi:transcriptional regulator CynR [Nocardia sp. PE-7]|uniref:transcriptional regulator CynR n=1 Tax=Nocardia sp. PE-7 TaxID=3058426 RepID=UPI00265AC1F7|nr:transcriptional regulator CynR [Nocardia sp. PE-7]WKG11028.1 transcriptional regulator CynR [Nocardia sp. PE-7]
MTPELRHLRYLAAVAEHGNFTRAAEELHVSQPTLSHQIKQLERAVGAVLLDRAGRSVRLTDAGAAYLAHARRAVDEVAAAQRAVHDVTDLSRGVLRFAATPTFTPYLIGPLIARFRARYPGIAVEFGESSQDVIESELLDDHIDLGIAFDPPRLPGIAAEALYEEALATVLGIAAHPDRPETIAPGDLVGHDLALLNSSFATRRHIDSYLHTHGVSPRITVEVDSIQALLEAVSDSNLVTILPEAVTDTHPRLARIPLQPGMPRRTVTLLRAAETYRSAAATAFAELLREHVR